MSTVHMLKGHLPVKSILYFGCDMATFMIAIFVVCTEGDEKMDEKLPSGYQFRHRRILSNASADGTECPALSQLRRCHTDWGDACTRWEVQPLLDTCHLADNATCGLGYHELVFRCRRYDGVSHVSPGQFNRTAWNPQGKKSTYSQSYTKFPLLDTAAHTCRMSIVKCQTVGIGKRDTLCCFRLFYNYVLLPIATLHPLCTGAS